MKVTSTKELREDIKNKLSNGKKYSIETRDYSTSEATKGQDGVNNFVDNFIYTHAENYSPLLYLSNLVASDNKLFKMVFEKTAPQKRSVLAENTKTALSDSDFYSVELQAKKLMEIYRMSSEVMYDTSTDFVGYSAERLFNEFYKSIEYYMINGTGAIGQPEGLLRYDTSENAIGGSAFETITAIGSATIQLADLENAFEKLKYQDQKRAILLCSPSCINHLRKLKDGDGEAVIQGKAEKDVTRIFDCPIIVSDYMEEMETGKVPAMFVNVSSAMGVLLQNGVKIDILKELWSANDLIGVKGTMHFDTKITNNSVISAIKLG